MDYDGDAEDNAKSNKVEPRQYGHLRDWAWNVHIARCLFYWNNVWLKWIYQWIRDSAWSVSIARCPLCEVSVKQVSTVMIQYEIYQDAKDDANDVLLSSIIS